MLFGTFYGMSMDTCMREVNWSRGSSHCQSQEAHKRWCASLDFYFLSLFMMLFQNFCISSLEGGK